VSRAAVDHATVQDARRERLAPLVAERTGLSLAAVRGRISRAHGRTLLRNLFADAWAAPAVLVPAEPPPSIRRRRVPAPAATIGPRTIHRVRQEFDTSCGVAVVAMLARVSHERALRFMFPDGGRVFLTHLHQLTRALDHFGVAHEARWHRFSSWPEILSTSIVKLRFRESNHVWYHWVIYQRRTDGTWGVIDPDRREDGTLRLTRAELRRGEGVSYIAVEPRPPPSR
jgi:hypothetical protein